MQQTSLKLDALNKRKIFSYLDDAHAICLDQIHVAKQLDSTNSWLLQATQQGQQYRVCTTELQTAGHGTKNRVWAAGASGTNIYLSFSYPLQQLDNYLAGLTLVLGIASIGALRSFGVSVPLFLKWPNDIFLNHGKLGGILVETTSYKEQKHAIIGIGLNLVAPTKAPDHCAYLASCMAMSALKERNRLVGYLLDQMLAACTQYLLYGFAPWQDTWNNLDYTAMQMISVDTAQGKINGRALGVDDQGHLLISLNETQVISLVAGEIILHDTLTK